MKRIWAPWRMKYLIGEKTTGCIFCTEIAQNRDRENYILHRGRHGFIMLNLYPYSNGHLMIAPYQHVPSLEDLNEAALTDLMHLINLSLRILRKALQPRGFNIGINIGRAAGAGIDEHVHIHIVPRWEGDTNFMPIIAETRVIPELLDQTYDKLRALLIEENAGATGQ
jgi:ATP adenylyltransferase